jgi:hypothetical protein
MTLHRGLLNWGVFLIVLAAIPLAAQLGYLDAGAATNLLRLWPLILIGIGIGLILRFTPLHAVGGVLVAGTLGLLGGALIVGGVGAIGGACVGDAQAAAPSETRTGTFTADRASVHLELTCVELLVGREPGSEWRVRAEFTDGETRLDDTPDRLSVTSAPRGAFLFGGRAQRALNVDLPQQQALAVNMTLNASRGTIRLPGGQLSSLNGTFNAADVSLELRGASAEGSSLGFTFNAASASLSLPADSLSAGLTLNASSLDVCVAPDVGLRIEDRGTVSANNYADVGLERIGDTWQTPDYDAAAVQTQLRVSANASSITLQRTGGCP